MTSIAVVAHSAKTLGGGLGELRETLAREGFANPQWYEVAKSREAPKFARRAFKEGADVVFVWGGDGTVQRCIDALAGKSATIAILPAGTANLLATNLDVPKDLAEAVQVGLHGHRRPIDTGSVNGERFAVMAGAGFDALMIKEADGGLKDRIGRAAYLWTGTKSVTAQRVKTTIAVDGKRYFKGPLSCVLIGNVGQVIGGVKAFKGARPDDGVLELAMVTAKNPVQWARTLGRLAAGKAEKSPFVNMTRGKKFTIVFDRKFLYELDGGTRPAVKKLRVKVRPASIFICVPTTTKTDASAPSAGAK
jgi:YegS/Rv2252/BmrU family lipid kinase